MSKIEDEVSEEIIDKYRTLNDEQYNAMLVIIDVARTCMVIHHKDGDDGPLPWTDDLKTKYKEVMIRDDVSEIIEGAISFVENQFPAMDVETGIDVIEELEW